MRTLSSRSVQSRCLFASSIPSRCTCCRLPRRLIAARAEEGAAGSPRADEASDDISASRSSSATATASQQRPDTPLYINEDAMRAQRPRSNLSSEMKRKLREEYQGWGGAENKAMSTNYFLWAIVVVGSLAIMSHLIGAI